jgi:hypothetical protein
VGVISGGTQAFTSANCGTGLTWSVSTGVGSVDSSGNYTAPAHVNVQNQSRGCQQLPNTAGFNIPVNSLPVDVHSSIWLARITQNGAQYGFYHNLKIFPTGGGWYDNPVTNSTRQQLMHFNYATNSNGYQDTYFPIPARRDLVMQNGFDESFFLGADHHMFAINTTTCEDNELYKLYFDFRTSTFTSGNPTQVSWTTNTIWDMPQNYPVVISGGTGAWAAINGSWTMTVTGSSAGTLPVNSSTWGSPPAGIVMEASNTGCQNCNSQSGQKFHPTSYAQLGGVDAANTPMSATSLKYEEWYADTQQGKTDLGHAIRTTLSNSYLSARYVWPAIGNAIAVSSSFNNVVSATAGSPTVVTSLGNISAALPCANYTYTAGCTFYVHIQGLTGAWAALNTATASLQPAIAIDNTHFSVAIDSSTWGNCTPANGNCSGTGAGFFIDFMPYGATLRLKSSFNVSGFCTGGLTTPCPYEQVLLRTLQNYGLIVADGTLPGDNWDSGQTASEFHPDLLVQAAINLKTSATLNPIEPNLEVVDRSSQQLSTQPSSYMLSNTNRTTVQVCGSLGCASDDVILQGATIGTDYERLTMAAGVSRQLNVWANGTTNPAVNYAIDNGITGSSVSSSGLLTMPSCTTKERGFVTVTSVGDPSALPLYIEVYCLPVSIDGGYRLALGNYSGDYIDSTGKTWWGSWGNQGFNNGYETNGLWYGTQNGTWPGNSSCSGDNWTVTDAQLYNRSTNLGTDTRVDVMIPNGTYTMTLYGEAGFGGYNGTTHTCGTTAGANVYDWESQGQIIQSSIDGYTTAGGNYLPYTLTTPVTVSDGRLTTTGRVRALSTYGMSWSSLSIVPGVPPLPITISGSFPDGTIGIPYSGSATASGGTAPYTYATTSCLNQNFGGPCSGHDIAGVTMNSTTGAYTGTPTLYGGATLTVQACDSTSNCGTQPFTLQINSVVPGTSVVFRRGSMNGATIN